eukprot:1917246-Rhodomonas_salina.1
MSTLPAGRLSIACPNLGSGHATPLDPAASQSELKLGPSGHKWIHFDRAYTARADPGTDSLNSRWYSSMASRVEKAGRDVDRIVGMRATVPCPSVGA